MGACSSSQTMEDHHCAGPAELVSAPALDLQHFKLMQLLGVGGFGVVYAVKPSRRLQSFVERYRRNSIQLHQLQLQQQQLHSNQQSQSMELSHSEHHTQLNNTTHHDEHRRLSISGVSDASQPHHHSPHHLHLPSSHHDTFVNITSNVAVINHTTPIPSFATPLPVTVTSTTPTTTLIPSASNSFIFSHPTNTTISSCTSSFNQSPSSSPPSPTSLVNETYCLKRMSKQSTLRSRFRLDSAFNERDIGVENGEAISLEGDFGAQFLLPLYHAFQTDTELIFVMPLCRGGNLLQLMKRRDRCMNFEEAKFYTAEIILGLQSLHRRNIVHRDLKHANVLLDDDGHVKICDFGLASYLLPEYGYRVRSDVGTDGYGAPEMRKNFTHHHQHKTTAASSTTTTATNNTTTTTATSSATTTQTSSSIGYGTSVDYYALGIMLYEMLHGHHLRPTNYQERQQRRAERQKQLLQQQQQQQQQQQHTTQPTGTNHTVPTPAPSSSSTSPSFMSNLDLSDHVVAQQELHTYGRCFFAPSVPPSARSLIVSLLCADPAQRLGCRTLFVSPEEGGKNGRFAKGWEEVKQHAFFQGIDWNTMLRKQITPPYVPPPPPFIVTSNNNNNMNNNNNGGADTSSYKALPINESDQHLFDGWEFNATIDRVGRCAPTRTLKQPASPTLPQQQQQQLQLQTTLKDKSADMMQVDTISVASTKAHEAPQLNVTTMKANPWFTVSNPLPAPPCKVTVIEQ